MAGGFASANDTDRLALSHQLRALRERGAVSRRKAGRIADYRLVDGQLRRLVLDAATGVAEGSA